MRLLEEDETITGLHAIGADDAEPPRDVDRRIDVLPPYRSGQPTPAVSKRRLGTRQMRRSVLGGWVTFGAVLRACYALQLRL